MSAGVLVAASAHPFSNECVGGFVSAGTHPFSNECAVGWGLVIGVQWVGV